MILYPFIYVIQYRRKSSMDDYFEMQENKEKEALEEKKYQELYQKQTKIARIILLACFGPIGLIFFIIGLVAFLGGNEDVELQKMGITFLALGIFFLILGLVFLICFPKKGNYARYKRNVERFGGLNIFDIKLRVEMLEEKVQHLKEQNKELKVELEELRRKR